MHLTISLQSLFVRRATFVLLFLAILGPLARAQDEESISVSFYPLSWEGSIKDLIYFDKGQRVPLFIPNGAPGSEQSYVGSPQMGFYTERTGPEGEMLYDLQATVTIPHSVKRLLLVFIPTSAVSNPQQKYKVLALPDPGSNSNFAANAFNFYNLTGTNMAIRVGDNQFQLSPGRSHVVALTDNDLKNVDVQMATSTQETTQWSMIYQSRWASPKKRRAWVFIYGEPGTTPGIRKYYQLMQTADTRRTQSRLQE
ncbi:MAG: hypothetical protein Q7Q73_03555 [Verrucomicrobiota bacterium JB024]|nr:hypothetical protein [Verrucomicrobiota bacterium JB024]